MLVRPHRIGITDGHLVYVYMYLCTTYLIIFFASYLIAFMAKWDRQEAEVSCFLVGWTEGVRRVWQVQPALEGTVRAALLGRVHRKLVVRMGCGVQEAPQDCHLLSTGSLTRRAESGL